MNSKRLLYTASYVTTQLTPEEQRKIESEPGGGYAKAHTLRSLDLGPRELDRLGPVLNAAGNTHREEHERLFAVARRLAVAERPMPTFELASALAPFSYAALDAFVELSATVKDPSEARSSWP